MPVYHYLNLSGVLSKAGIPSGYDVIRSHNKAVSGDDKSNTTEIPIHFDLYNGLAVGPIDFFPGQKLLGICDPSEHQQTEQQNNCDTHGFAPFEVYDPMPTLLR